MKFAVTFANNRERAGAFAAAAAVMLIPANMLPVLSSELPGQVRSDTILSGIAGLCEDGSWGVAGIVFTASILVPLLKLVGLTTLLLATRRQPPRHRRALTKLYAILDLVGRWSMLDVFLVAFLSGAVQFGALAKVQPQSGIIAFAAAVVLTMLATDAFDPHVLWQSSPPVTPATS
jgi:paraquat-inducible protein A